MGMLMSRMSGRFWVTALSAVAVSAALGWQTGRSSPSRPASVPNPSPASPTTESLASVPRPAVRTAEGYVGSEQCATCHADLAARYHTHPMARSTCLMRNAPVIEDEAHGTFEVSPRRYIVRREGDEVHHEVERIRPNGSILYEVSAEIAMAIGSGRRGRSYVTQAGSRLYQSPITWYSGRKAWGLSPGFDDSLNAGGFERTVLDGCVQCHVGRALPVAGRPNEFEKGLVAEAGIGCERCHGPGEAHIARHEAGASARSGGADPIINPARLTPHERDSVCYQCHLQGTERIPRSGYRAFDFRPGDKFEDIWVAFQQKSTVRGTQTDAVSQVDQFRSSQCFQKSAGKLGCVSCHDPHQAPAAEGVVRHYRERCLACHQTENPCRLPESERLQKSAEDSCIVCHMPKLGAVDIPHTSLTDHRILKNTSPLDPAVANGPLTVFQDREGAIPDPEIRRARGILMSQFAVQYHDRLLAYRAVELLKEVKPQFPEDSAVETARGVAQNLINRDQDALQSLEEGARLPGHDWDADKLLGIQLHQMGEYARAANILSPLEKASPGDRDVVGRLIHSLGLSGRFDQAFVLAQETVARFPYDWQLRNWLSAAYRHRRQPEEAKQQQQLADELQSKASP